MLVNKSNKDTISIFRKKEHFSDAYAAFCQDSAEDTKTLLIGKATEFFFVWTYSISPFYLSGQLGKSMTEIILLMALFMSVILSFYK